MIARLSALEQRLNDVGRALAALATQVAGVQQGQWSQSAGPTFGTPSTPVLVPAYAGSGIPAAAAGVAGSASVTLYDLDPGTGNLTSGATVTAWNAFPSAVGSAKWIYVAWSINSSGVGMWVVPSEAC